MGFRLIIMQDLIPASQLTTIPNVPTVNNDVPAKSAWEFIEHLRRDKETVSFGSSGNGASQHLAAELFKKMAQVDMKRVPTEEVRWPTTT